MDIDNLDQVVTELQKCMDELVDRFKVDWVRARVEGVDVTLHANANVTVNPQKTGI